jgi:hypothetical protein
MTRRSSVRAQAQEIYCEMVAGEADALPATPPTPDPPSPRFGGQDPSPQGGGEHAANRGESEPNLTARIRALYEDSAVPVREIARLAGVTERTLYKYVIRQNWKRRYRVLPRGEAAAAANCGRRWREREDCAPVKGAGGRFIHREDNGKPFAQGLKATDPAGRAVALVDCERAEPLAREAQMRAEEEMRCEERLRAVAEVNRTLNELTVYREQRAKKNKKHGRPAPADERYEKVLMLLAEVALKRWTSLQRGLRVPGA